MTPSRTSAAALLAALAAAATIVLFAQSPPQPQPQPQSSMNHNLVFIDPAHGGPDAGASLGGNIAEKDVTLQVTAQLRAALTSQGFTVVSSRDAELPAALSNDDRAAAANRTHAVACIVLHATATGSGVHLYASTLEPEDPLEASAYPSGYRPPFKLTPWDEAQAESAGQSQHLEGELAKAMAASLPLVASRAAVAPLDNLMCPAVVIELAPLAVAGSKPTPVTDPGYQQRVAETVARSLLFWRGHAEPPRPQADSPTADDWMKAIPQSRDVRPGAPR